MTETRAQAVDSPEQADDVLLETLPKEVGVLLLVVGVGGLLMPGPIGSPFLVVGGVVLFPRVFRKVDEGMKNRFPDFYRRGMRQVRRFVTDLERRYPTPRLD